MAGKALMRPFPGGQEEHRVIGRSGVSMSERGRELKRRRHRRKKLNKWHTRLEKATVSERAAIAEKIRQLTPGAEVVVSNWGLEER